MLFQATVIFGVDVVRFEPLFIAEIFEKTIQEKTNAFSKQYFCIYQDVETHMFEMFGKGRCRKFSTVNVWTFGKGGGNQT